MKQLIKIVIGFFIKIYFLNFCKNFQIIFLFHDVIDRPSEFQKINHLSVSKKKFEKFLIWIKKNFNIIEPNNIKNLKNKSALITFDDGFKGSFINGYKILKKYHIPSIQFLNFKPIKNNCANIASTLQYLEIYNAEFEKFCKKLKIKKPYYLNIDPKNFKKYKILNTKEIIKIKKFQGDLIELNNLKKFSKDKLIFFGNHFFDHWNLLACSKNEIKNNLVENEKYLQKFKNYLGYVSIPNGKFNTCFNMSIIKLLKKFKINKIFSSNGGTLNLNNSFFDRISVTEDFIDNKNLLFFEIFYSKFRAKLV